MRFYHRLGSVCGIEVGLHVSWYPVAVLLAYSLAVGYFPKVAPDLTTTVYAVMGLGAALLLFLSVLLHELAHALVARSCRLRIERIYLFFFGGISQMREDRLGPLNEVAMASAGPLFSIALGGLLYWFSLSMEPGAVYSVIIYLGRLNLILGFFNLIPGFPLDGGRILRGSLWAASQRLEFATWYATRAGKIFGILLAVLGGVSIAFGDAGGFWLMLLGGFLYVIAESSFEQTLLRQSLSGRSVREIVDRHPITVYPSLTVDQLVKKYFVRLPSDHLLVEEHGKVVGMVNLDRIARIHPHARKSITVQQVMVPAGRVPSVSPHDSLMAALESMGRHRLDLLPVFEGRKLYGTVSRSSVVHLLRVSALREESKSLH